ncbi:glycosyltransferase family 39 protein [Pelagibacteraceae bacterium]|nr:glycosyltransferase family 39 protein [Pelagibacteraceae bacterium]MDC1158048.1 glycosyltransferase family 39 protein [Pelagibacteraceae bacterium]
MIAKKNIKKVYILFLILHLFFWTLAPSISNINLPLDTIEALAWGSNLEWGFSKHPPFSAFAVEIFYTIFGSNDWAYYLLSQIFVIVSLIYVWKFSNEIFDEKIYSLLSVLTLSGIYYYNFTTPEFNVNVSQLPFWALTVYFFWKSINSSNRINWILFGIFSALGFLSKYLFIYILLAIFFYFILNIKIYKKFIINYLLSIAISLAILTPHFIWLSKNNFITIVYGLNRSALTNTTWIDHLENPLVFIFKQILILIPFLIMIFILLKKFNFKFNLKNRKNLFLISINLIPIILILFTSIVSGAKIRTMWMTPFYLFFGTLFIEIFRKNIDLKKIRKFLIFFLFLFILSPAIYLGISIYDKNKRTDFPGKEIARLVQNKWNDNFVNDIKIVVGDEWFAGNLSYHLNSRPVWFNDLKNKVSEVKDDQGVIYVGNSKILKEICPGVFGKIAPVGYCMIGKR